MLLPKRLVHHTHRMVLCWNSNLLATGTTLLICKSSYLKSKANSREPMTPIWELAVAQQTQIHCILAITHCTLCFQSAQSRQLRAQGFHRNRFLIRKNSKEHLVSLSRLLLWRRTGYYWWSWQQSYGCCCAKRFNCWLSRIFSTWKTIQWYIDLWQTSL